MTVYIGSDHNGYEAKKDLIDMLRKDGYDVIDKGPFEYDPADDYPDFAFSVAEAVASDPDSKGILICGSGGGVTVAANKVQGIRAVYAESAEHAKALRTDDDANIIILDQLTYSLENDATIVQTFLNTPFSQEERHIRRISKISKYESEHYQN